MKLYDHPQIGSAEDIGGGGWWEGEEGMTCQNCNNCTAIEFRYNGKKAWCATNQEWKDVDGTCFLDTTPSDAGGVK